PTADDRIHEYAYGAEEILQVPDVFVECDAAIARVPTPYFIGYIQPSDMQANPRNGRPEKRKPILEQSLQRDEIGWMAVIPEEPQNGLVVRRPQQRIFSRRQAVLDDFHPLSRKIT